MNSYICKSTKKNVKQMFDGLCAYCGNPSDKLTLDHVNPRRHGGRDRKDNLLPACVGCNRMKATYNLEKFRELVAHQLTILKHNDNFRNAERFGLLKTEIKPIVFYFEVVKK